MSEIKRGDLHYANLNPVCGSEQGGLRPVVILQNDVGNKHSPTVIVAAVTSQKLFRPPLPTHRRLTSSAGLNRNSTALLEQIRTIDKQRLKGRIGTLCRKDMRAIDKALAVSVGLDDEFRGGSL